MPEPNKVIRKIRFGRPTIGVIPGWQVHGGVLDSFLPEVFRGIQVAVADMDCNLMLAYGIGAPRGITLGRPAWPLPSPDADFVPVGPWNTDGLIVIPPFTIETGAAYFRSLIHEGFPVVFAGDNEPGPSAIVDNEGGIQQAYKHLISHGHRRIAYIAGWADRSHGDSFARLESYLNCVKENGLDPNPALIAYGYHSVIGGRQAINEIYNRKERFTAVITSNDEAAVGAMQGLRDLGLVVPQDVAVIGFDDRLEAKAQVPILTTVVFPMFEMGYRSVEILLDFIRKGVVEQKVVKIPVRLVIRESCGCLPGVTNETSNYPPGSYAQPGHIQPALLTPTYEGGERSHRDLHHLISMKMTEGVFAGTHVLGKAEIEYLCNRIIEAFKSSLALRRPDTFRFTVQQIIERVSSIGEDLYSWQAAISFIRDHLGDLDLSPGYLVDRRLAEDLLHEARIAISEVARGQATRELLSRSNITAWIGQLTTYMFSAHDEAELFSYFASYLPSFSIRRASVALYQGEGDDPYAWSNLCFPAPEDPTQSLFSTRTFPPRGLFPEDPPFHLAILPLLSEQGAFGYVAFDTDQFDRCAEIVRQLAAALKVIMTHQEALESRKLAEERRLEAEEANRLKSRFLSMVSHELRTPLHLISGLSDILLHEYERPGQQLSVDRKDLERIFVSSQYLDGLIRDVLDLARSDIGQLKLMREPIALKEMLDTVAVIGEQLAHDKNLAWVLEIPDNLPEVWGDRTRLRQVALNLVANAVKFTTKGQVILRASVSNGDVTVSVSDTGLGIPLEEQKVIFDEFRQSDRTTARGYGGLGLGLAICKRLVEMHGGTIGVHSTGEEGSGSDFYFTLPAIVKSEDVSGKDTPLVQAQQVALLVNDIAGGNQLKDLLTRHGINVEMIKVGDDDEHWMTCLLDTRPDIAVLDLGLTSKRGWEILKVLNGNPALQEIPVLFYKIPGEDGHGSLLEINYLTKPVRKIDLAETLISQGLIEPETKDSSEQKILVVDDEPAIVELHTRIINSQIPKTTILKAYNGREALEKIRQEHPSLVLLDLMMPEINGFQVLSTMRDEESSRNIPVIVLTGQSLTQDDMDQLNDGVVSVLGKGMFKLEEIALRLKDIIARKRKPSSDSQKSVLKAMAFIHANYADSISRHDLASYVGLSERHLTRCFRQEIGITPITYLNRFRVRQAKVLLDSGERSISRVALDVGFSTGAYFARVFQEEVGKSPRDYLRKPNGDKSS